MKSIFNLSQLEEIKGGVTKFDCTLITITSVTTSVYVPLAGWFMLGYAAACWTKKIKKYIYYSGVYIVNLMSM
ncbi:MAG: hypothetical protein ACK4LB_04345 [Spirosomataceae bacterium]